MYTISILIFCLLVSVIPDKGRTEYIIGKNASYIVPVDLDMDGDEDLLVEHRVMSGQNNPAITIMENNGYGELSIKWTESFTHIPGGIYAIPIDNNDSPDIICYYSHYLRVYYNDGFGNFSEFVQFDIMNQALYDGLYYGDFNGDSLYDVVVISYTDKLLSVVHNNGQGGFTEPDHYYLDFWPTEVRCDDLNTDGRDDIIIGGINATILYSTENGFEQQALSWSYSDIAIKDFDLDDDPDLICAKSLWNESTLRLSIFENNGAPNFENHLMYFPNIETNNFICSDFNNNSLPDLLFTQVGNETENGRYYILENTGSFTFESPITMEIQTYREESLESTSSDLDNNGYNEIITVGFKTTEIPNLHILFNAGDFNFQNYPLTKFQTYSPSPGYEFISSRIIPFEPDMTSILDTIMNGELGFVRSSQGEMLQKVGDEWVNGIGDWQTTEGYLFYLNDTASFDIVGTYIDPQTPIALEEGYQFISFLPGQPMNALQAFYDVLYSLEFVRNSEGEMLMLIGNEWVNNIGNMQPKEGYLVKMHTGDTLFYP